MRVPRSAEKAMPSFAYARVNVFTGDRFGGNPLAVLPDARGLSDIEMQAIAREFNLSETTFVLPPDNPQHHARVRIFTPAHEMPFAGHPNVGTGFVLGRAMENPPEHLVFEEIAGLVRVHMLRGPDKQITGCRISAPQSLSIGDNVPTETVAACASLKPEDILSTAHDRSAFRAAGAAAATPPPGANLRFALLLYVRRDGDATRLRARMFAPLGGVVEDPATGSACAALAALLTSMAPGENVDLLYEIEQGVEMGRPSLLIASGRKTAEGPVEATVAGSCVSSGSGTLEL